MPHFLKTLVMRTFMMSPMLALVSLTKIAKPLTFPMGSPKFPVAIISSSMLSPIFTGVYDIFFPPCFGKPRGQTVHWGFGVVWKQCTSAKKGLDWFYECSYLPPFVSCCLKVDSYCWNADSEHFGDFGVGIILFFKDVDLFLSFA